MRWCLLLCWIVAAVAGESTGWLPLQAPLTTMVTAPQPLPADAGRLIAEVEVSADAPADLGVGIWVTGLDGAWFQHAVGRIAPGRRVVVGADLDRPGAWTAQPGGRPWDAWRATLARRWGVFLWSGSAGGRAQVRWLRSGTRDATAAPARLLDLAVPTTARTGERWAMTFRPDPYPAEPCDPAVFSADLEITRPDGAVERIPAFHEEPQALVDRGDREIAVPDGPARFCVRWRPRVPGEHRLRLRWSGGACELRPVAVSGAPWDDFVRVDRGDPRFLARGDGRLWWPVGLNLQAPSDERLFSQYPGLGLRRTPDRGTRSYDAYFARLSAAGGDAAEVWLASWNLALEWTPPWPGQLGLGRYSQVNAAKLDRLLDLAWERGIRIVLNLHNHGQVLPGSDEDEWPGNPYNRANGGPVADADEMFTDPEVARRQANLRRYLVARFADHPAVVTWKLWSEVDLTSLGIDAIRRHDRRAMAKLRRWHEQAAADFHRLDTYGHPVSTHFATTWQLARPEITGVPGIDLVLIDAYFTPGTYTDAESLAGLMEDSAHGLHPAGKPFLATEFGGGHRDQDPAKLLVEHAGGPFLALVTGHAGAPMLWWRELVDQRDLWGPYRGIRAFLDGEDLRGRDARSIALAAASPAGALWARAWSRPGRMLAYVQDRAWAVDYRASPHHERATIGTTAPVAAGGLAITWWDPDSGTIVGRSEHQHPGGPLRIPCPAFSRHLAAKIVRSPVDAK